VQETGVLDVNSSYCYLVLCKHFAGTSVTVRERERLAGFLTALILPNDASRLFVWQVGVSVADRGRGLAKRMLRHLLTRPVCRGLTHIETTVSPGNTPSRSLFASLARDLGTTLEECETYGPELFPEPDHEPEQRLVLGPFDPEVLNRR
jgi:L-2,4-diaminobutyric acid acetyltransferase